MPVPESHPAGIGGYIAALREQMGLTQEQLASRLGIEDSTVSRWEADRTFPRPRLLKALASELGVTVADLLGNRPALESDVQTDPDVGMGG